MRKIFLNLCSIIILLTICVNCKKSDTSPQPVYNNTQTSTLKINIMFGNQMIIKDSPAYVNTAGNTLSVSLLKFFIGHVYVSYTDGSTDSTMDYFLVDLNLPNSQTLKINTTQGKTIKTLKFLFGVDSKSNSSGKQTGALDPSDGMFWTWNTGYLFYKCEGFFFDKTANKYTVYLQHYSNKVTETIISLEPKTGIMASSTIPIPIKFDINTVFGTNLNTQIDLTSNKFRQSTDAADEPWIYLMHNNINNAFSLQ